MGFYLVKTKERVFRVYFNTVKMPQCSVPGCTDMGGHKFPTNKKLRKAWIVAFRRADSKNQGKLWEPGIAARVCTAHFVQEDYKQTRYYGITNKFLIISVLGAEIKGDTSHSHHVQVNLGDF